MNMATAFANPCLRSQTNVSQVRPTRRERCFAVAHATSESSNPSCNRLTSLTNKAIHLATIIAFSAATTLMPLPALAEDAVEPVYFGNGCFWGRQYDFIKTEQEKLGRSPDQLTAVVGYAAGKVTAPKVCYYYTTEKNTVYESLGHAEVVKVDLDGKDRSEKEQQYRTLAQTYFSQFRRLPNGKMLRQDPQDQGPGYRNVIGIPGGVNSPFFDVLQQVNKETGANMELKQGSGNEYRSTDNGRIQPTEDDLLNVVWVVDSDQLPFYRAEMYHQFHNGLGKKFSEEYTKGLKDVALKTGKIKETGCPEYFFVGS